MMKQLIKKQANKWNLLVILSLFLVMSTKLVSQNVNVSGALVGNGTYATLGAAFTAINGGAQTSANIVINVAGNTTEPATALLNNGTWSSFLIQPSGGALRTITGSVAGPLIDLNGVTTVTINGLNTGGNALTISNTDIGNLSTSTIRFINDASNNSIINTSLLGSGTSLTLGTVIFSTAIATGNSNNVISNNIISAAGTNFPTNSIYAAGTATATNNNNNILNNSISDFFNPGLISTGINLASNNSNWAISSNRFFQTTLKTYTTANTHRGILIAGGNGYTINNNIIGYSASNATGTYGMTGTIATRFTGIEISSGTLTASSIAGNTITAITLTTSSGAATGAGILCGISLTGGNNIVVNNLIGGTSGTNLIQATPSTAQGAVVGINCASTGTISISTNSIGGLTSTGVTAAVSGAVAGINVTAAAASLNITNNIIGNTTTDNMRAGTSGLTTGSSLASGMNLSSTATGTIIVNGNTIRNFSSYGIGTGGYVRGIWTAAVTGNISTYSITNNNINNLASNNANTTISNGQTGAQGINLSVGTNGAVSGNTITNVALTNNTITTVNYAAGITHGNATSSRIFNNRIFNVTNAGVSTATTAPNIAAGIIIRSGTTDVTIFNNFISLGNSFTNGCTFIGIQGNHGSTPDPINRIYFNTINIEGTAASGSQSTFGYMRGDFLATARTASVDIKNNIITNTRTGGTGFHFTIGNNFGNAGTATGWGAGASNNNVLNSTAATIGHWNGVNYNFTGWQTNSVGDANSYSGITVTYVNSANDLHLNMGVTPTLIESNAQNILGFTTDIDGQLRPGPLGSVNGGAFLPDIGADEIDGVPLDINAPIINQTPLTFTCATGNRTFTASLLDLTGVPTTGTLQPRVYFRKNVGPWFSDQGVLASGTANNGVWSFTITSATMGGLVTSDVVSYYVIAQDLIGNIGSNPSAGLVATNVNSVTTAPTNPNSYAIAGSLSGLYTVGATGTYTSLTAAANAYNTSCLTGSVVFSLTDATYPFETFPITFLNNVNASITNSLLIKPAANVSPTITGSSTTAIIVINGGDFITLNGSNGNLVNSICPLVKASKDLTVINTNLATASAVLALQTTTSGDGATNNSILNTNVVGIGSAATGVAINISGPTLGSGVGSVNNSNNSIVNNSIQSAQVGIFSAGQSITIKNSNNVYDLNELNGTAASAIGRIGIMILFEDAPFVRGNNVGNITSNASNDIIGITLGSNSLANSLTTGAETTNATVTGNIVNNILQSNTFSSGGIILAATSTGTTLIANNSVNNVFANGTGGDFAVGIYYGGGAGLLNVFHNSIHVTGTTLTGASQPNIALAINGVTPTVNIRNNILICTGSNGFNGNTGIGLAYTSTLGNYANLTSSNNDIFVSGTSSSIGRVGSLSAGTQQITLANWQTETGKDLNSANVLPNFVGANDLHLVANNNAGIENAGAPIALVPTDIDCTPRNTTAPDIGFDEVCTNPSLATAAVSNSLVCSGSTVALSVVTGTLNDATAWNWYTGSCGGSSAGTGTLISVAPTNTTSYFVSGMGGCITTPTCVSVTVNTNPLPAITTNTGSICVGNSFTIVPSGASTYTFSGGSAIVSPVATTNYTVSGTNTLGCNGSTVVTVTVNALPTVSAVTSNTLLCEGQSANLTASGATTYSWNTNATSSLIAVSPTVTTTYTVTGTNANGCKNTTTITQSVSPCTGVNNLASIASSNILIYPNPNNGEFLVNTSLTTTITIYNGTAQLVYSKSCEAGVHSVKLNELVKGIYFVKANDAVYKMIVE